MAPAEAYPCRTVPTGASLRVFLLAPADRGTLPPLIAELLHRVPEEHSPWVSYVNTASAAGKRMATLLGFPASSQFFPLVVMTWGGQLRHARTLPADIGAAWSLLFNLLRVYAPSR